MNEHLPTSDRGGASRMLPLVLTLVVGIAEMGEMRALKTIGLRTLLYTVVVSSIAVAIIMAAKPTSNQVLPNAAASTATAADSAMKPG